MSTCWRTCCATVNVPSFWPRKNNVGTYLLDLINRNPDPKLWTVGVLPKQRCCAIRLRMWLN